MTGRRPQKCPECGESLNADCINIKEGVALCPCCESLTRLSELYYSHRSIQEVLNQPPRGCSIDQTEQGFVITASLRSAVGFTASACFALFWNGIVSVFVLIAVAGLYANLVGPLPVWFPAPQMAGKPGMKNEPMELGTTLFLCVFLIPFVAVGIVTAATALTYLIGKVQVVIDEQNSYVASGIGFIRWKTRFDPNSVHNVRFATNNLNSEGSATRCIELLADRTIKFGSMLSSDRMEWVWAVLKTAFHQKPDGNPGAGDVIGKIRGLTSSY